MSASAALAPPAAGAEGSAWRIHLAALGLAWAAILAFFHRDAIQMVSIWWDSSTFNHCLLILPLIFWLVRQRLPELGRLAPAAWWPGLALVAAGALAWLVGEAGGLSLARHFGLVTMLQGCVVACLGKAVARGLFFPIFYAWFLVPAGEEIQPAMQTITADMVTFLLRLTRVPAHIEGVFISIPTGNFQVAEACSGVKFLVAMLALGALAANVCFRSWRRRIPFLIACVLVPILANGIRAWGTIYIAWLSGSNAFAESFDHVVYGWIFFAIVIALILGSAWPWFDRQVGDPWFDPLALQPAGTRPGPAGRLAQVAAVAITLAAAPLLWSSAIASAGSRAAPAGIALPTLTGWTPVAPGGRLWQPHFAGADRIATGRYRDASGDEVDLAIIVYARQSEGHKLIGFGQGAAGGHWAWTADAPAPAGGRSEMLFSFGTVREVISFYRIGSIVTGSPAAAKLETMKAHLLGGPQRAVAILVSAEQPPGGSARPALDSFLRALGPIDRLADRAAGLSN
jgi:exosortase A